MNKGFYKKAYIAIAVCVVLFSLVLLGTVIFEKLRADKSAECASNGAIYVKATNTCRNMTEAEKREKEVMKNIEKGLQGDDKNKQYTTHDGVTYEKGSPEDIAAGKKANDYCLSAAETWNHIGEEHCVVFSYTYLSCSKGYCFLDEKKDYKNGFVAFFGKYNMYSWDTFRSTFYNNGPIMVCGKIISYENHPEIKISSASQFILKPSVTLSNNYSVYINACK